MIQVAFSDRTLRRIKSLSGRLSVEKHLCFNPPTLVGGSLVCLSSAPSNAKVIRTAARMADAFHGAFTALFVETQELSDKDKSALRENVRLAEQLGAQIATVYGEDIPGQIAEYAKASRVSKIVMGRSGHIRRWLKKPILSTD